MALTAYFVQHAVHGRHGLESRQRLEMRASMLAAETAKLEAVRAALARDVALLSPEIPEADLVEEIARSVLGYARPGERILRSRPPVTGL
jgi:cell division protein FtsB